MDTNELRKRLERAILPSGTMLFRPTGSSFIEMDGKLVMKAFDDIMRKVSLVEIGVDEFSAAEKVLFMLFIEHGNY